MNDEIAKRIADDRRAARKRDILCSIPGLGPVVAAAILAFLPEIGTLARKQAGSLAKLVPHSRESGQWKGKSFISGGRKPLRDALYMPALVAMRFNPDLKAGACFLSFFSGWGYRRREPARGFVLPGGKRGHAAGGPAPPGVAEARCDAGAGLSGVGVKPRVAGS